jgi:hypothetical protein
MFKLRTRQISGMCIGRLVRTASWGSNVGAFCRLVVTFREVVRVFLKQLWFKFVPVFHGLQWGSALKNRLRELLIIEQYITVHRRIKVFP